LVLDLALSRRERAFNPFLPCGIRPFVPARRILFEKESADAVLYFCSVKKNKRPVPKTRTPIKLYFRRPPSCAEGVCDSFFIVFFFLFLWLVGRSLTHQDRAVMDVVSRTSSLRTTCSPPVLTRHFSICLNPLCWSPA